MIRRSARRVAAAGVLLLAGACSANEDDAAANAPRDAAEASVAASLSTAPPEGQAPGQGTVACTPAEASRVAVAMDHAAALGIRIAAYGSTEGLAELTREAQDLNATLSPACNAFMARLGEDLKAQQAAGRATSDRYSQLQNHRVYYDAGTDTYMAPGIASCSPSGCMVSR